jgi:hypothetical protein
LEAYLSRIINIESAGKERSHLSKLIVLAIRELALQNGTGVEKKDLAAFIAQALERIDGTIDISVTAWEKRGYWVKADRFRMEWAWTRILSKKMQHALQTDDWATVAVVAAQSAQKLQKITVSPNHRLGKPWIGAWKGL